MNTFAFVTAALLALIAVIVVIYLLSLLFLPGIRSIRGRKDNIKFKRAAELIVEADNYISEKNFSDALRTLKKAPLLEVFTQANLVQLVRQHHQNILSRCVLLAEEMQTRAEGVAEVERLSLERAELMALFMKAIESYTSLKNRREKAGKDMPTWSKSDYEQRIKDIHAELENNKTAFLSALNKLFASIESGVGPGEIVYH